MITISITGILWSINGWHVFYNHGVGAFWAIDAGLWHESTDVRAAFRSWPEKALTSTAGNLPIMLRAVRPWLIPWKTLPSAADSPLSDLQMQAHVFGQKYAWLMIMGLHVPLIALFLTSILMVAGLRSKSKSRVLRIVPLHICLWGMLLLAFGHQRIPSLADESPYSSLPTCLSGTFLIWLALGILYSFLILMLLFARHGPKLVWYMLKPDSLRISCPQCGRSLNGATKDMIGDTGVCPKCRSEFVIE